MTFAPHLWHLLCKSGFTKQPQFEHLITFSHKKGNLKSPLHIHCLQHSFTVTRSTMSSNFFSCLVESSISGSTLPPPSIVNVQFSEYISYQPTVSLFLRQMRHGNEVGYAGMCAFMVSHSSMASAPQSWQVCFFLLFTMCNTFFKLFVKLLNVSNVV